MKLSFAGYGEGPPLLILHGLFGSGRNWTAIARALAERWRVLAVDLRNHGASPWDAVMDYRTMAGDVLQLIETEGLDPPVVLGHSMGGKTAMAAALSAPGSVRALIVADIAPVAYARSHEAYVDVMRGIDLATITRRAEADAALRGAVPEEGVRGFLLQNLLFEDGKARWRLNLDAIADNMGALVDFPWSPGAVHYGGPTLFVAGAASPYVAPSHHDAIRGFFPMADIEVIAGAGHWVHAEKSAEFLKVVDEFLAGI
jgi:pimeloyl-ACP methyl ester carboxylesterase